MSSVFNPMARAEGIGRRVSALFFRDTVEIWRDGVFREDIRCMLQKSLNTLNIDPAVDDFPELVSFYVPVGSDLKREDIMVINNQEYRLMSTTIGRTWKSHEVAIAAFGGDVTPSIDIKLYRAARTTGEMVELAGIWTVYIVYSDRMPKAGTRDGLAGRRVSATLISNDANFPAKRYDTFSIIGTAISGSINDVIADGDGWTAPVVLNRGYEEP